MLKNLLGSDGDNYSNGSDFESEVSVYEPVDSSSNETECEPDVNVQNGHPPKDPSINTIYECLYQR